MDERYDEMNHLIRLIIEEHISADEVREKIKDMSARYGDDLFPEFIFSPQSPPWNEEYMEKLKRMNVGGACSKDFLCHMAEVGCYIEKQKNRKKLIVLFGFIAAIILLVIIMICIL